MYGKTLARNVAVQDDWLRNNFTLFKLGEVFLRRYFALGQGTEAVRGLTNIFDLFKV